MLARLGGDEFAILLPNTLTAEEAAEAGERVLQAVGEPIQLADLVISVGMSIGVALAPRHGVEASGLLKRADMAMYAAKATNRGLRLWESGMGRTDAQQLTFAGELPAPYRGELTVYAQPVASLITGEVTSGGDPPRWQHPERGLLAAEEFMSTAASSGLASELARHILTRRRRRRRRLALVRVRHRGVGQPARPRAVGLDVPRNDRALARAATHCRRTG